jgi:hypothetical protein
MIVTNVGQGMRWTRQRRARSSSQGGSFGLVSEETSHQTNGAEAYGEIVWSWHPLLVLSRRRFRRPNRVRQNH